jgi:hypothetical protein
MLFGRHPWKASNIKDLKLAMLNEKLEFPQNITISKDMKKFLITCLAINPDQRA